MGYLIDILICAASRIVTGEVSAHIEPMARWIIGKAAGRLPREQCERFREEWNAHLQELPGCVAKLWHALGCYIGAGKLGDVLAKRPKRTQGLSTTEAAEIARITQHYIDTDPEVKKLLSELVTIHLLRQGGPLSGYILRALRKVGKPAPDLEEERLKSDKLDQLLRRKVDAHLGRAPKLPK